jgi:NADPH:quinone reductase
VVLTSECLSNACDVDLLAPKPSKLSMRRAAALPLVAITAWEGLVDRAKVCADQTVLVHAGAGRVSTLQSN